VLAAVLLIAVHAVTSKLIPLYAIGVFTGFTISQAGPGRYGTGTASVHRAGRCKPPSTAPARP
jgi:hypothetical protein